MDLYRGIYTKAKYEALKNKISDKLCDVYGSSDKFDIESYIDSSLTERENLDIAEDSFHILFDDSIPIDPLKNELDFKNKTTKRPNFFLNGGIMYPLSSKIPTYNLFGFDIETTGRNNRFLMGSIVGNGCKHVFWNKEEMINHILTERKYYNHARLVATNLYFDFMQLFYDTEHMKNSDLLIHGSRFLQVKMKTGIDKKKITFIDTLNYSLMSVKTLGKIIGIPKMETPPYILENRQPRKAEYEYIEKYNLNDSEITYKFMVFLQQSLNNMGCKMRITAASTAMDLFKRHYLKERLYQEDTDIMSKIFKAYYGGRVEVFKRGKVGKCNYYDFNSLYPSVMRNEFPCVSKSRYLKEGDLNVIKTYQGVSEVEIEPPEGLNIPLIPFRDDMKLTFPTHKFKGWYSNLELREALKLGYDIRKVGEQVYYTRVHRPFQEYVNDLYSLRKKMKAEGNKTEQIMKLLMNSLYGKFGQKLIGQQKVFHIDSLTKAQIDEYSLKGDISIDNDFIFLVEKNPSRIAAHILPIYAVYTTAYGRLKLYNAIKDIDVVYVDTDSIVTPCRLHTSNELGELKLEYEIEEGVFIRPKMYGFKTKEGKSVVKIKGNSESHKWNYDQFLGFITNPKTKAMRFSTFKHSNKRDIGFNSIIEMEKVFGLEDNKRIWPSSFDPLSLQSSRPIGAL